MAEPGVYNGEDYDKLREDDPHYKEVEDDIDRLIKGDLIEVYDSKIRTFKTGATRNSDKEQYDYEGFMSPLVIERFGEYMNKHRIQDDGSIRDSDNWQNLFGDTHNEVCLKSGFRHFIDIWLHLDGYGKKAREGLEDALCAIIFNMSAILFNLLQEKYE